MIFIFLKKIKTKMVSIVNFFKEKLTKIKLKKVDEKNIGFFTLAGQKIQCKCISVYDGDTVTLVVPIKGIFYKMKCRLHGIDTPEKRCKDKFEKECAIIARDRLIELIDKKIIWVDCVDWDKYGRLLAKLYLKKSDMKKECNCINQQMLDENLAYEYLGKTKIEFSDWSDKFNKPK